MYKVIVNCKGPKDVIQKWYNLLVQEICIKVKYVCRICMSYIKCKGLSAPLYRH